ncbi:MAG TPA: ABC transporter substrate-binding protein [Candidatus Binatia bacterium]
MKAICKSITLCALIFFAHYSSAAAQQTKVARIGFLGATFPSSEEGRIEAFRQGLRELGYVEGKNIVIEYRWAEGKLDRLPGLAAELVRLNVDVIVAGGSTSTGAARKATSKIPIVMAQVNDPVGSGFVAGLARPGGNITGLSTLAPELSGKQLELLEEIVPRLSRVAIFGTSTAPGNAQALKGIEVAATAFGANLQYFDVLSENDLESSFLAANKSRAGAALVLSSPVFNSRRKQIANIAMKNRLPAIYFNPEFVEDGGLMTYAASYNDLYRRAAIYVDKILKGAKPADLPVEQPTKFELIINLKAAKRIGLTIPPNVLARADRVIK